MTLSAVGRHRIKFWGGGESITRIAEAMSCSGKSRTRAHQRLGTEISNPGIALAVVVSKSRLLVEPWVRTNEGESESRQVCPKVLTKDYERTIITKGSDKYEKSISYKHSMHLH